MALSQPLLGGGTGATVGQMLPSAPPLNGLRAPPEADQSRIEKHSAWTHSTNVQAGGGSGNFFDDEQKQTLMNAQALADAPRPVGAPPAGPPQQADRGGSQPGSPSFTTSAGVPVTLAQCASGAQTTYDGWHGVKSSDARLKDADEVMRFLQTYNSRPQVACRVQGYHDEIRTREVSDGKKTRMEEYTVQVEDFSYQIDLTRFVFPYGFIQSMAVDGTTVPAEINQYLADTNKLKTFNMTKLIGFDFVALERYVYNYIRSLGWWRGLMIDFPMSNYTARVYDRNALSAAWENPCCWCLMVTTILPWCVMKCYGDWSGHKKDNCKSFFKINYDPLQIFAVIRPALWCTGFTIEGAIMEGLRDLYW
jgi:hypothetical protein